MRLSLSLLRQGSHYWINSKSSLIRVSLCKVQRCMSSSSRSSTGHKGNKMSHILKSPYDKKNYREITLSNGLTALLISDMDQISLRPLPVHRHQSEYLMENSDSSGTDGMSEGEDLDKANRGLSIITSEEEEGSCEVPQVSGLLIAKARESPRKGEKKRKNSKKKHSGGSSTSLRDLRCKRCGSRYFPQDSAVDGPDFSTGEHSVEVIMAAAALCVGVGSFCDPEDIPGFSHFLEHMVFMGSKKYKKENAFDDFITKHGGESNAWTDTERTVFFFDIHKNYFHKALDMFAQFFISPLFLKSSVDREIMAVDNEFQMIKYNDSDRYHQIMGNLAFKGNPIGRFLCGNKNTLQTLPEEEGIDVYGRLRDFSRRSYSAHYMTLVVQAPEPLDALQTLVYDYFEEIPNNGQLPPSVVEYRDPFVPRNFHKLMKVVPVEDCQRLDICWPLPPLYKRFKCKPLDYLGLLITHEGPGSIMSCLRKRGLALSLSGGNNGTGFDQNKLWSGFNITIILTEIGMERVCEVITIVFEYIAMLQKCGPQAWFYKEMRDIESIKFRFRDELDPIENVESVAESMQLYPLEHYLTGRSLILNYDAQLIRECLSYMAPIQSCLTLWSKAYEGKGICDRVEQWFGTHYTITDIPEEWERRWENVKPRSELSFPEKNPFIPSKFELLDVENPSDYPVQVLDSRFGRMWYKKDRKFKMPKGFILLHMMTPVVSSSVKSAALCDLYISVLEQQLLENLYAASLTGYEFSVEGMPTGLVIHLEGFSHKLPRVMELFIMHISGFSVAQDLFNAVKSQLKKSYYNEMIKAHEFGKMVRAAVTEPFSQPVPDRFLAVDSLTLPMLQEFHRQLMDALYVEGLMTGNFVPQQAVEVGEFVQKKLCRHPLPEDKLPVRRVLKLPMGSLQCRVRGVNHKDTNSSVTSFFQYGPGTIRDVCLNELLAARMKEPVFNKLRTEHQLGYSVFCQPLQTSGVLGFAITVETHANKFSMSEVENHIADFLVDFRKTINKMSKSQFVDLVNSVITAKQVEDTQLGDETIRFWQEVLDRFYVFDRQDKEIDCLNSISQCELKSWFSKIIDSSQCHVSFQVEGCKQTMMEVDQEVADSVTLSDQSAAAKNNNFLQTICKGEGFISNIDEFRRNLQLYPITKLTS